MYILYNMYNIVHLCIIYITHSMIISMQITMCQLLYVQYLIYCQHFCGAGAILSMLQMRKWRLQSLHWCALDHTAPK